MSPGALATESAHCATRTAKTSSAQLQQGARDTRGAKSLPRRKARKAPICTRCDDRERETRVCNRYSAKSLPCRVAWKATICAKHKGWQAPTHAGRDDREETIKSLPCRVAWKATICAKRKGWQAPTHAGRDDRENTMGAECYTSANMQLIAIVLLLAMIRIDPHMAQDGTMSPKKIDWNANPIPKLPPHPTATQIEAWSTEVAMSAEAATGSEFIARMMLNLTKKIDEKKKLTCMSCEHPKTKDWYDLLDHHDDLDDDFQAHMVAFAYAAGAPIDACEDIKGQKDNSLRDTYANLKYYMAGFNKQMRLAAYEAKPAAFNQANRKYKKGGLTTNPFQGIVVWHLITRGTTVRHVQKKRDEAKKRVRKAAEAPVDRAVDVAGWLEHINEVVDAYYFADGSEAETAQEVLPEVLKTLETGLIAYGRADAKEWRALGVVAEDFKKTWDETGAVTWEEVYEKMLETYNELFEGSDIAEKGKLSNGPLAYKTGVSFASIDAEDESMAMAATFSQPATLQDYRNLMDATGSQAKAQERDTETPAATGKETEEDTPRGTRPIKAPWPCGQKLDDGTTCGYRNSYYEQANRSDHTVKEKCDNCGQEKLIMLGSNDATTLAEEFKRSQDIINKALVAMTEQMAGITQSLKAAYSKPTADGFGLTAMASAGINVPDFTGSVFDVKPDLGMAHLLVDPEDHGINEDVHTKVEDGDRNSKYVTPTLVVVMLLMALAACDTRTLSAALV